MGVHSESVVVTGLGAISPHGRGVESLWKGVLEGKSALAPLGLFDASAFRNPLAGVCTDYPAAQTGRAWRMLDDAVTEAMSGALGRSDADDETLRARVAGDESLKHAAIVIGTNFGGMSGAEQALIEGRTNVAAASLNDYLFSKASNRIADRFQITGPKMNLSLSCASGTAAIGLAFDMIRNGRAEYAIAAGFDELSLYVYAGLSALRAITPEVLRPFDLRRKGTLFSEGAGCVILESEAHARARKAPHIYARVLGRALNNDAYHMTAPEQEARGIQALMRSVLADANVLPEQIDHLNLHATGTPFNDAIETKAIHAVFGERGRQIPVCSVKSSIGHTMGAAGVLESIVAMMTLRDGKVPPILGLDPAQKDPACDLNTPTGMPLGGDYKKILKTSYGFGGTNAAVILERYS
jgi:3-oxoacyl-[acyl-carrier-protein] synthase II